MTRMPTLSFVRTSLLLLSENLLSGGLPTCLSKSEPIMIDLQSVSKEFWSFLEL